MRKNVPPLYYYCSSTLSAPTHSTPTPALLTYSSAVSGSLPFIVRTGRISPLMQTFPPD